ncbi:MAG: hypothetical protein ACOCV8_00355 [Spirochaetota bacterium]
MKKNRIKLILNKRNSIIAISLIIVLFTLLLTNTLIAQTDNEDLNEFFRAQKLYDKAIGFQSIGKNPREAYQLFEEASSIYLNLINKGYKSAYLYYNLANSYFNIGELGKTIYYYKIADKLKPSFRDIDRNLAEARSEVKNYIEDKNQNTIIEIFFFWHFQIPLTIRLWIGITSFILIWIIAGINLLYRKRYLKGILIALTIISAIFIASITTQYITDNTQWWGVVTANEGVEARKGPGENYEPSFTEKLSEGIEFTINDKKGNWYKVKLKNNEICWIPEDSVIVNKGSIIFIE